MKLIVISSRDRRRLAAIAAVLGLFLAAGFIPASRSFAQTTRQWLPESWLGSGNAGNRAWEMVWFPLLAGLFLVSIRHRPAVRALPWSSVVAALALPVMVALIFGLVHPAPPLFQQLASGPARLAALWYLFCVPLGEEWLFRGWVYDIGDRLSEGKFATATNPLPVAIWFSAIAFSLWHVQNLGSESVGWTVFQVGYTSLAGLWLGYLRWRTAGVTVPVLAHLALNAASNAA